MLALMRRLQATAQFDKVSELQCATGALQTQEPASTAKRLQNFELLFVAVPKASGEPGRATAQAMLVDESAVLRVPNVRFIFALILIVQISIQLLKQKQKLSCTPLPPLPPMLLLNHCNRRHHSSLWSIPANAIWCSSSTIAATIVCASAAITVFGMEILRFCYQYFIEGMLGALLISAI